MSQQIPELFQDLFREYYPMVFRKLMALIGQRQIAEDLAQEVFLKLYRNPPNDLQKIGPWLHRVTMHAAYDFMREKKRDRTIQEKVQFELVQSDSAFPSGEQVVFHNLENERIQNVLNQLSMRDRNALLLKHSGYSYQEIAQMLEVNPTSVGSLVLRATERFKKLISGEEVNEHERETSVRSIPAAGIGRSSAASSGN